MDWSHFEHLMELSDAGRLDEAVREGQALLAEADNDEDRGSLLVGAVMFSARLGRLKDARRMLEELKALKISDLESRMNAEFCEPCLLVQEGRTEQGISAFSRMLQRYRDAFQEDRFRYLYRDIQCRTASALVFLSRFAEALPILLEAAGFDFEKVSDEQDVRYALGLCLEQTGDLEAAKREYHRVVSLDLKSDHEERARYALSRMYCMAGGFAQARKQLEIILQGSTGVSHPVPREHVYLQLSWACHCLGDGTNERRYADLARSAKG